MRLTHKDRWEQASRLLRHVEGKYNLGAWVIVQRYRKDHLSVERKKRLDKIGFVWNWRDFAWERDFAALLKFKRREGHCRVRGLHREGKYKLGSWVAVQRSKKNVISPERKARLNKIGFVWKTYRLGSSSRKRKRLARDAREPSRSGQGMRPSANAASPDCFM